MERRYRVTLTVEATFERKATGAAKDVKDRLLRIAQGVGPPWAVKGASITSVAKPKVPPPPEPTERQVLLDTRLKELRDIVEGMARIVGNAKRPRVHLWPNRWCEDPDIYPENGAHAHNRGRWKGLICIQPKKAINGDSRGDVWLMAHEYTHIRLPGGTHNRAAFKAAEKDLEDKYRAWKAGTYAIPERAPGWAKAKEVANVKPEGGYESSGGE